MCNRWYGLEILPNPATIDLSQITMEDLQIVEHVVRKDPKVIEQCGLIGIPKEDMHKVYCDRRDSSITMKTNGS